MLISRLNTESYTYYNLHAEQVITSTYKVETSELGIFEDILVSDTIEEVLEDVQNSGKKNIILDFYFINNISNNNINQRFSELIRNEYKFVFLNVKKEIVNTLGFQVFSNHGNTSLEDVFLKYYLYNEEIEGLNGNFYPNTLFRKTFEDTIKNYITPFNKPHSSSYVYLHSYVDIKDFITNDRHLFLYSMYLLSKKIREKCLNSIEPNPILVCQSLNSSLIVSILSNLLKLDILILDKIGPVNKLYSRLDKKIVEDRNYIIVSDLVCLGTEVKIVKNLIQFLGGRYLKNVSLIKIETLADTDIDLIDKKDLTISVFSINKKNNKNLNYKITTNLEDF